MSSLIPRTDDWCPSLLSVLPLLFVIWLKVYSSIDLFKESAFGFIDFSVFRVIDFCFYIWFGFKLLFCS